MSHAPPWSFFVVIAAVSAFGCSSGNDLEPVAQSAEALNTCDENVPTNRYVDGFPAYAQCDSTMSSSIWSNNGIDTSTTSLGSDWIRTQQGGGYQCTELARRYMHFRWHIDYQNGDAGKWCDGRLPATLVKSTTPVHGDLIVFAPGSCGASATTGHIAVVDTVNASTAKVTFVEENEAGRRSANQSCAACFLHAVANDGSTAGAGGAPSSGGVGGTAGQPSTGGATHSGAAGTGDVPAQGGHPAAQGGAPPSGGAPSSAGTTATPSASAGGSGPAAQSSGGQATSPSGGAGAVPPSAAGRPETAAQPSDDAARCALAGAPGTTTSRSGLAWLGAFVASALFMRRRHARA